MKKRIETLLLLKELMDPIFPLPMELYYKLEDHISEKTFKKKQVVRQENDPESEVHLILKGSMALFKGDTIIRPFFKGELAFDDVAFYNNEKSPYTLKSIQESLTITVTINQEYEILNKLPDFTILSNSLKERAKKEKEEWAKIVQMHYTKSLPILRDKFGKKMDLLSRQEISDLVGISKRTLQRYYKEMHNKRSSIAYKILNREILDYPFKAELHPESDFILHLNWEWVSIQKLFRSNADREKFQKMKLPLLACRLFPEGSLEMVNWISKLFVLFFMLDDYTDKLPKGKKTAFWSGAISSFNKHTSGIQSFHKIDFPPKFCNAIKYLWNNLSKLGSPQSISRIKLSWSQYFIACKWEAANMDHNIIPGVEEYLSKRPDFSGGNFAVDLIPLTMEENFPDIHTAWYSLSKYRSLAARLIFISNDLLSYEKEKKQADPHNWVNLICHQNGISEMEAKEEILAIHDHDLEEFLSMEKEFMDHVFPRDQVVFSTIKNLKYQISGAVAWSVKDTLRYLEF
ncbi:terpene synthase family protein [Arthrospiribacter ruber]|uniref:Terpene synthase n=1 Tax=Arthrospiribacter ruber TaxID=2487934 RepID=A0A951IRU4_9BACT|nr:terpene synthase [Arthrospiribacter ruber]MBW3466605.1 terpene synthase [Arthrospiribacter ruber]